MIRTSERFFVRLWQIVMVALQCRAMRAAGSPTILLRPRITTWAPKNVAGITEKKSYARYDLKAPLQNA